MFCFPLAYSYFCAQCEPISLKMMKFILSFITLAAMTCLLSCNASNPMTNSQQKQGCPIKKETTSIHYTHSTNSGIAVLTEYIITQDSLTWYYTDHRNGFTLRDMVKYDSKEYEALINTLSQVQFKVRHENTIPTSGGSGFSYAFYDSNGKYLGYGKVNNIASGDNKVAEKAIADFLNAHMTAGEKAVEEAKKNHLLYIDIEEFPESLMPYKVE